MPVQAKWKKKKWELSRKQIKQLEGISTEAKLKSQKKDDENGDTLNQPRGFELETIKLEFVVADAVGVDVRREIEEWKALVGQKAPLYLGGKIFGPATLLLISAKLDADMVDPRGIIRTGTISLSFEEFALEGANKTRIRKYITFKKKGSAAKVGASAADKKAKKPVKKTAKKK